MAKIYKVIEKHRDCHDIPMGTFATKMQAEFEVASLGGDSDGFTYEIKEVELT